MKEIPLTKGLFALVDDEDFDRLNQWNWRAKKSRKTFYADRHFEKDGRRTYVHMHRLIVDAPLELEVDHKDGNGLNNQRYNLRICTQKQNRRNISVQKNNRLGYKGVHQESKGSFSARITVDKKLMWLGSYKNPIDAAKAYDLAATKHHGEFARTNF